MSHTATIDVEVKDTAALQAACRRLGVRCELNTTVRLFDRQEFRGHAVYLDGWKYPVVFTAEGKAKFDNYNGRWGAQEKLDQFRQRYAVEAARRVAQRQGKRVQERKLQDGSIQLVIQ